MTPFTRADLRKGAFSLACHRDGRAQFVAEPCYHLGLFAIHRDQPRGWRISHAPTGSGIPACDPDNLYEAVAFVNALTRAIRWRHVKRGRSVGAVAGMTKQRNARLHRAIEATRVALGKQPAIGFRTKRHFESGRSA